MALASPPFILLVSIVNLSTLWWSSCHKFIWTKPMIQEEAKIKLGVDSKCALKDEGEKLKLKGVSQVAREGLNNLDFRFGRSSAQEWLLLLLLLLKGALMCS